MCLVGKAILGKYLALEIMDATFLQVFLSTFLSMQAGEKKKWYVLNSSQDMAQD